MTTVLLSAIRRDGGTQPREEINAAAVEEYAERLTDGDEFPPVTVFYDGSDYWLADGFHRAAAHDAAGLLEIAAEVRQGTRRDAVLHSVGANASHGLRRTNADKRRAVLVLLEDAEWGTWSNSEIARRCGVSHTFVNRLRGESSPETDSGQRTYTTKHGTPATMDVSGIREAAAERKASPAPEPAPVAQTATEPERAPAPLAAVPSAEPRHDDHEPDLAEELEHAHAEIARLEALADSLQADDKAAEILKLSRRYAQLEGRLQDEMRLSRELKGQADYQAGLLKKIRAALRVEKDSEILTALTRAA